MRAYAIRRLLALIPTLFFASVIVFVTVRLIPGSVIDLMLAQNPLAAEKDRAAIQDARCRIRRHCLFRSVARCGALYLVAAQ